MINNVNLFKHSLNNLEPLVDDFYVKKGTLIISNDPQKPNKLIKTNKDLINNITAYEVAQKSNNKKMQNQIIQTVQKLLENAEINYSEFVSFWAILDVSYSAYRSLTNDSQLLFIKRAIEKYLDLRHNLYLEYGYSPSSLQVSKDAKLHKSSGSLGINKCAFILDKFKYKKLLKLNLSNFDASDKTYIFTDKTGKKLFREILEKYNITFKWSSGREKKMPDILFKNKNNFYIIEHKHMKEGGGGQDKQINEIIEFIKYKELDSTVKIHYVSFLDGSYFNLFSRTAEGSFNKLKNQLDKILSYLNKNTQNYFVNSVGFYKFLEKIES